MQTSLEMPFADGVYSFAPKIPQLAELQRKLGCGIFTIYGRLMKGFGVIGGDEHAIPQLGEAYVEDILETIRLFLIGGGYGVVDGQRVEVSAIRAKELVDTYCFPNEPLKKSWDVARSAMFATVEGYEPPKPEPVDEPEPQATDSI